MSLAKFAKIFKLPESKGIFPYEKFRSITEISEQVSWPKYVDFSSSLPKRPIDYTIELRTILNDKSWDFGTLGDMFSFFQFQSKTFVSSDLHLQYFPELMEDQLCEIKDYFRCLRRATSNSHCLFS